MDLFVCCSLKNINGTINWNPNYIINKIIHLYLQIKIFAISRKEFTVTLHNYSSRNSTLFSVLLKISFNSESDFVIRIFFLLLPSLNSLELTKSLKEKPQSPSMSGVFKSKKRYIVEHKNF